MKSWFFIYLAVFAGAAGVSAVACALARRLGAALGWLDKPAGRKAHTRAVAVTGGYGIFGTFLLLVGGGSLLATWLGAASGFMLPTIEEVTPYLRNVAGVRGQVCAVLGGAGLMFLTGAIDDRRALGPRVKLAMQIVATLPLLAVGVTIHGHLPAPVGWAVTGLWIVLLTNSFNLLDNMDGLSASVAAVACGVLALAAYQGGELWLPALFLCMAGALVGFLFFNWHPASIFMGDAGSLTTGYLMAVFSILVTYQDVAGGSRATPLTLLMPLAIMGVPLFDTLSVMFIRRRAGKPLMQGDRNHFSHRLVAMGFGTRGAVATIALLTAATGLLALPLRWLGWGAGMLHVAGLAMLFGVIVALEVTGRRQE
jgi:UDP-GlcNAc:undecaprenyl-phosphate GlcNAc-1-phosphate transferase